MRRESFRLTKSESRKITVKKASTTSIIVTSLAGIVCGVTSPKPKKEKFSTLKKKNSNSCSPWLQALLIELKLSGSAVSRHQ